MAPAPASAVEAVEARDATILAFLTDGPASGLAVLAAVSKPPNWTDAQHREACTLALRRLRLKRLVEQAGDTWMLAS